MCTAIHEKNLFGRTLDLECSYGESVTVTPREFPLDLRYDASLSRHFAFMGCAHVRGGLPLYYDGFNEKGLAAAALNFPVSAVYSPPRPSFRNLASFEVIPSLLAGCGSRSEARAFLSEVHVTDDAVASDLPPTPLHWIIADKSGSLIAEPTVEGLVLYDNPVGVLTNEPPFPYQMTHLCDFLHLSPTPLENRLDPDAPLRPYSRGMGGMGLPGDASSASRFVRAVFAKTHTVWDKGKEIDGFFHVMDTVAQPKGFARIEEGKPIYTVFTDCMDLSSLSYSYTTYDCRSIRTHFLQDYDLDGDSIHCIDME